MAPPFELRVGSLGFEDLAVVQFHGRERISRCYALDVTCALRSGELDEPTQGKLVERHES
jgi:uncharacterized protein involved in type VI secretion and phage assembly